MLKWVRIYLAFKGQIIYDEINYIYWSFIRKLHEKQCFEEMHCATKIRNRHIKFCKEKIKIFLATQVLSSSVSSALYFLEFELKDADF